jgi:ATP-binding protein involved in chromosome partitioning
MADNAQAAGNVMRPGDTSKLAQNDQSSVKHVIGVVSGKGGVGKSLVSGLIACDAARKGLKVGILDADITGPTIPHMFGFNHVGITAQNNLLVPARTKDGIEVMSINLLLRNPDDPVIWRGPVIGGCVKQFWNEVVWGDLDVLVVDMPPGTGDVALTVFQSIPVDGVVIVASPQDLVATIVGKAVNMAKSMEVPVLGLVENMSYFECPDCGKKHYIFGDSHIDEVAEKYGVEVLARLPMNPDYAAMCDAGKVAEIPNPGIDAEKLLDKAAAVKVASSLMGGWTVAE